MGTWLIYLIIGEFLVAGGCYIAQGKFWLAGYAIGAAVVNWCVLMGSK